MMGILEGPMPGGLDLGDSILEPSELLGCSFVEGGRVKSIFRPFWGLNKTGILDTPLCLGFGISFFLVSERGIL